LIGTAIGNRYGKALLSVALEHGTADRVLEELEGLVEWLAGAHAVRRHFSNITVEKVEKRRVMLEILPHLGLTEHVANLLRVMADNGRLDRIVEVVGSYRELLREPQGILGVRVTTAAALVDTERDEIRQAIATRTGKQVVLEETVDSEIIGGLRYRIGSSLYDASVKSQLSQMKESLIKE